MKFISLFALIQLSIAHDHTHSKKASKSGIENNRYIKMLFPNLESPWKSALASTFYISSVPNFLLYFVPKTIKASRLNLMVSFAVGGLLGDVFLHLLPHSFQHLQPSETQHESHKYDAEDIKIKNIVTGLAIFLGFVGFLLLDKLMRALTSNSGHNHSHEVKENKKSNNNKKGKKEVEEEVHNEIKLGGYLNMIADATHNFTDGLAMAASFYASPQIGISTTIAVFFHEIPHEVGDFAILLQSGFTRYQAMMSQFVTAIGALLGTIVGCFLEEFSASSSGKIGFLDGKVVLSDLVIPATAGSFLYIATVSVIPELLETPKDYEGLKKTALKNKLLSQIFIELFFMLIGISLMTMVSLYE